MKNNRKLIPTLVLILVARIGFGQIIVPEKCGKNNNARLNKAEAAYFNEVFQSRIGSFNFEEKRAGFFTGSTGNTLSDKTTYFSFLSRKHPIPVDNRPDQVATATQILILTEEEKKIAGGYDVVLVSYSKIPLNRKSRARLLEQLKITLPDRS